MISICWLSDSMCWRVCVCAKMGGASRGLTSEQQEKSAAPASAGAVSRFEFHSHLVFDTYLVMPFHLLLFAGEAACAPWYRTSTSWCSNQTLSLLRSAREETHQIESLFATALQKGRRGLVIPGKICLPPSTNSDSCALTTGVDSTLRVCV